MNSKGGEEVEEEQNRGGERRREGCRVNSMQIYSSACGS
jgi:hypothetical protein